MVEEFFISVNVCLRPSILDGVLCYWSSRLKTSDSYLVFFLSFFKLGTLPAISIHFYTSWISRTATTGAPVERVRYVNGSLGLLVTPGMKSIFFNIKWHRCLVLGRQVSILTFYLFAGTLNFPFFL